MFTMLSLLALGAAAPSPDIPTLNGEKPHFGFACHPAAAGASGGKFRYYVYMPENRPLGMPQKAQVSLIDGSPSSLPEKDFVIDGTITHIVTPPPPPPPGAQSPAVREQNGPETYLVGLHAQGAAGQLMMADFWMSIVAVFERQADGQYVARLKPSRGTLSLRNANDASSGQVIEVECDDLTGGASPRR